MANDLNQRAPAPRRRGSPPSSDLQRLHQIGTLSNRVLRRTSRRTSARRPIGFSTTAPLPTTTRCCEVLGRGTPAVSALPEFLHYRPSQMPARREPFARQRQSGEGRGALPVSARSRVAAARSRCRREAVNENFVRPHGDRPAPADRLCAGGGAGAVVPGPVDSPRRGGAAACRSLAPHGGAAARRHRDRSLDAVHLAAVGPP